MLVVMMVVVVAAVEVMIVMVAIIVRTGTIKGAVPRSILKSALPGVSRVNAQCNIADFHLLRESCLKVGPVFEPNKAEAPAAPVLVPDDCIGGMVVG